MHVFKRLQVGAVGVGAAAHVGFWAYQIGTNEHPLGWLCGEISCWVLLVAELPLSILYMVSNRSGTYGSLLLGSAWWGVLAAGLVNIFGLPSLGLTRVRQAIAKTRVNRPVLFAPSIVWAIGSVAAVFATARAIHPWLTAQ